MSKTILVRFDGEEQEFEKEHAERIMGHPTNKPGQGWSYKKQPVNKKSDATGTKSNKRAAAKTKTAQPDKDCGCSSK